MGSVAHLSTETCMVGPSKDVLRDVSHAEMGLVKYILTLRGVCKTVAHIFPYFVNHTRMGRTSSCSSVVSNCKFHPKQISPNLPMVRFEPSSPMPIFSHFFRPEDDEPTSPANALILLTLGFVFAAFILPLLFAGIQSKNPDIAGADDARLCEGEIGPGRNRRPLVDA